MNNFQKITIESYNDTVEDYIKFTDGLHQFNESDLFVSHLSKNSIILDLGCAYGRDVAVFLKKGFRVVGIDLSKKMIESAKERVVDGQFYIMDVKKLKFEDNFFDGVWGSKIFLHLSKKDVKKSLQETHRVLKPNGIFFLSVKMGKGEKMLADIRYGGKKKFWSFFQKEEIEREVINAGFKIIKSELKKEKIAYDTNQDIQILCKK